MSFFVSTFSLPKRGHAPHENQDSCWPSLSPISLRRTNNTKEFQTDKLVTAVADGATEGLLSEIWSRILVARAGRIDFADVNGAKLLADSRNVWGRFKSRKQSGGRRLTKLPEWLEEPSLEIGAFATLIALELAADHTWTAYAVGDSCVFHVRDDALMLAWPLNKADDFSNRPYLISSEERDDESLKAHLIGVCGRWAQGDSFFLMSDALAAWFLTMTERDKKPWQALRDLGTDDAPGTFEDFTAMCRDKDGMRNDDVTLVRIDTF